MKKVQAKVEEKAKVAAPFEAQDESTRSIFFHETDVPSMNLPGTIAHQTAAAHDDPNFRRDSGGRITLNPQKLRKWQDASEDRYLLDYNYGGIIDAFLFFVIGKGVKLQSADEAPAVDEYLQRFLKVNKFNGRDRDIVLKTLRAGECFVRFYRTDAKNRAADVPVIRVFDYWEVHQVRFGADRETPEAYGFVRYDAKGEAIPPRTDRDLEWVEAKDVVHVKHGEKNAPRGVPPFSRIAHVCQYYLDWLFNRVVLNRFKTAYYLEEIVKGPPSAVTSQRAKTPDADSHQGAGGETSKRMPKPGSKLVHNEAVEYKFLSPNVQADDASEDGRAIRMAICAGAQAPEFVIGDASQSNYASTLVAQNPFVRKVEFLQDMFEDAFGDICDRAVRHGIAQKAVPSKSVRTAVKVSAENVGRWRRLYAQAAAVVSSMYNVTDKAVGVRLGERVSEDGSIVEAQVVDTVTEIKAEWPTLIAADVEKEARAFQLHQAMGIASRRTLALKAGYDFDAELDTMDKDGDAEPSGDMGFGGDDRDDEIAKGKNDGKDDGKE